MWIIGNSIDLILKNRKGLPMKPIKSLHRAAVLAAALCATSASQAVSPTLLLAATLQPETMFLGFIAPVTSAEFLSTVGLVVNNVPLVRDFYGPAEQWLPRARKWSINSPSAINPLFKVPPKADAAYVQSNYSQVIAFGDSMSDTGNLFKFTQALGGAGLPQAPSFQGRFSDGMVALEVMSNQLRLPLTNYCFSGGQTGRGNLLPFWSWQRGMLFQIDEFHRTMTSQGKPSNDPQALYFLWAGPNDFFEGINMYSKQTAITAGSNNLKAIRALYARGSRHFLIPLMPDLSLTPQSAAFEKQDAGYRDTARLRSEEYKAELLRAFEQARAEMPGIDIRTYDNLEAMRESLPRFAAQGMNVTEACYTGKLQAGQTVRVVCPDPQNHFFWDKNHPTERIGREIGAAFAKAAVAP
jgi:phospholipase/lecithinase/hemolysin